MTDHCEGTDSALFESNKNSATARTTHRVQECGDESQMPSSKKGFDQDSGVAEELMNVTEDDLRLLNLFKKTFPKDKLDFMLSQSNDTEAIRSMLSDVSGY